MNRVKKASPINSQAIPLDFRISLFHSTPVLDRRRRNYWDSGGGSSRGSSRRQNYYSRRNRKMHGKQELLRNVGAFAEHIFQSWQYDHDEYHPFSSQDSSWFRCDFGPRGFNGSSINNKGPQTWGRRGFQFCEEEEEVETIFCSAFGGNKYFFWSFINEEPRRTSSGYSNNHQTSWNRRRRSDSSEDEYDSSTESDSVNPDLTSDRLALGLRGSGPLSLDDVKNAYRTCALKWHPDRHMGSSKAIAEEKFKVCSAAYQSICDKLAGSGLRIC